MPLKRVFRKKGLKKRLAYKKRGYRRRGVYSSNNVRTGPNTCKVIETLPEIQVNANTPYLFEKFGITGQRAPVIASQFGLYRIASIKYTYRPRYDTYSQGIAGTANNPISVPTLYWKMNRYGDVPTAFDADTMRALGCKPFRLDDKNVVVKYKPNILVASKDNSGGGVDTNQIKITPWLNTDERPGDNNFTISTATHYGHALFVDCVAAGTGQGVVCDLDVQIVYEFKNPRMPTPAAETLGDPKMSAQTIGL